MERTLLPMTLAALFALSLSACATTRNSAADRPASNPPTFVTRTTEDKVAATAERAEQRAAQRRRTDRRP